MRGRYKNFLVNIFISFTSILIVFLVLEVSMRAVLYFKNRLDFSKALNDLPDLNPEQPITVGQIIKPSQCEDIVYELRPNIKAYFSNGDRLETNSLGWRGPLYPVTKTKNTVRIVILGDSHMFGWGVANDALSSQRLEDMLNTKFPQKKWEVINTAVPGYNTYMEVETLATRALIYKPDIVIMEYIGNDTDLANFMTDTINCFNLRKSFLVSFIKNRVALLNNNFNLIDAPHFRSGEGWRWAGWEHRELVPDRYIHMVGWDGIARSLLRLRMMQQRHNFATVILISHDGPDNIHQRIMELSRQLQFHILYSPQDYALPMILSPQDQHPSALAHEINAGKLLDFMEKEEIIDKFIN